MQKTRALYDVWLLLSRNTAEQPASRTKCIIKLPFQNKFQKCAKKGICGQMVRHQSSNFSLLLDFAWVRFLLHTDPSPCHNRGHIQNFFEGRSDFWMSRLVSGLDSTHPGFITFVTLNFKENSSNFLLNTQKRHLLPFSKLNVSLVSHFYAYFI